MKCKVCNSKWRHEIDVRILNRKRSGESYKDIAKSYMGMSESAIQRHARNHMKINEIDEDASHKDISLEEMRNAAIDAYFKASHSGNVKITNDSLGHLIRIEELIAKKADRDLLLAQEETPLEITLRWADDKPMQDTKQDNPDSYDDGEMLPEIELQESEEPTIEDYKRLALEARPTELVRDKTGEIIGIRTEAGFIPKQKEPLPLDPPLHVDADFEEIDDKLNDGNPHLMPDGSFHQRYGVNKKSKYDIPEAFSC